MRTRSLIIGLLLSLLGACGGSERSPSGGELLPDALPAMPEPLEAFVFDEMAPPPSLERRADHGMDIRRAQLAPEILGESALSCHLSYLGRIVPVPAAAKATYPGEITHQAPAQCAADGIETWVTLALKPEEIEDGHRPSSGEIWRVAYHTRALGPRARPVLSLLSRRSATPPQTGASTLLGPVPAADDFTAGSESGLVIGEDYLCGVKRIGDLQRISEPSSIYPPNAAFRLLLECRSVLSTALVDVALDEPRAYPALFLRRGEHAELRLLDPSGGRAGVPLVTLQGLPDAEAPEPAPPPDPPEAPVQPSDSDESHSEPANPAADS